MKKLSILAFVILMSFSAFSQDQFFALVNTFLAKNVNNGKVNYSLIKNNPSELNKLISLMAKYQLKEGLTDNNKAFFINAYNLTVISQIIQSYPIESPMDIPGFFDKNKFMIASESMTLNFLENEILRPQYKDPRFHFVLVCGAVSCPPITSFAYMPDKLEAQMDKQTKLALNNTSFIRYQDDKLSLSEIFKWYEEDFTTDSGNAIDFINGYRNKPLPVDIKTDYYPYDWTLNEMSGDIGLNENPNPANETSNIFEYTPSSLLNIGEFEAQLFNNIYTQTAYRNKDRETIESDTRDTYYGGSFYVLYGISKNARVNIGFDLNIKSVFSDTTKGSPFEVLKFSNTTHSRTAVTSIGPKIKFQPFNNFSNFSVQSAFWIPVAKDLESIEELSDYPWMDYHMYTWWNQFFFDKTFGDSWQIFTEADLLFRFKTSKGSIPTHLDVPVSFFLSWFPSSKATIYGQIQYSPRFQLETSTAYDWDIMEEYTINPFDNISDYAQAGLGGKYQVTNNFNLEVSGTYFFMSKNGGAGYTMNLGLRYILKG